MAIFTASMDGWQSSYGSLLVHDMGFIAGLRGKSPIVIKGWFTQHASESFFIGIVLKYLHSMTTKRSCRYQFSFAFKIWKLRLLLRLWSLQTPWMFWFLKAWNAFLVWLIPSPLTCSCCWDDLLLSALGRVPWNWCFQIQSCAIMIPTRLDFHNLIKL